MRHFFTLGAAAALLTVACGGVSNIGDGINGVHGQDGGDPGKGGSGTSTGGSGNGTGGSRTGTGGSRTGTGGVTGGQCTFRGDCPIPDSACQKCADGSTACPEADCIGGKCVDSFPTCSVGAKCTSAGECAVPGICKVCPDGSASCATGGCVNGQCVTTFPACPGGGDQCNMDSDCPIPPVACKLCADGSCAPAKTACVGGQCNTTIEECSAGALAWFATCGPPVCQIDPPPSGLPPCAPADKVGAPCQKDGMQCDTGADCSGPLQCATEDPTHGGVCPLSPANK